MKERKLINLSGVNGEPVDGMVMTTECMVGKFKGLGNKKKVENQIRSDCSLYASMESQTLTVSVPATNIDVIVRIGDVVDLLMATNSKHKILHPDTPAEKKEGTE